MKDRNIGIDILKFIAVLLITNTHLDFMYVKFSQLATGGAIGNVLFFFCSGFTLFLKPFNSAADFPNWYKRRINRIYPAVLAVSIVRCLFFDYDADIITIILHGGRWFVTGIMVMYVFIYFIGLYCHNRVNWVLALVALATIVWFYSMDRPFPFGIFGNERYSIRWLLYFLFMLLGARMGLMRLDGKQQAAHQWRNLLFAMLGVAGFYLISGVTDRVRSVDFLHVFCFVPMLIAIYYLYWFCEGDFAKSIYNSRVGHFLIRFVGGLCLEIYLIQNCLFTDKLNFLFPLNIPLFFIIVVMAAYLCRILARFISQTFKDGPYDWKKMVDVY